MYLSWQYLCIRYESLSSNFHNPRQWFWNKICKKSTQTSTLSMNRNEGTAVQQANSRVTAKRILICTLWEVIQEFQLSKNKSRFWEIPGQLKTYGFSFFFILIKKTSRINLHYCSTCVREGTVRTTQQQKNFVNQEHTHIFRVTSVGLTSHSSCETVTLVFLTNLTAHTEELFEKNSFVHVESRIRLGKTTVHF